MRVVADTNLVLATHKSKSPTSPNREFFNLLHKNLFSLLLTSDIIIEYIEKLEENKIPKERIKEFVDLLLDAGELIEIQFYHIRRYPTDLDDVCFLLCAINGNATHLLSYDQHLLSLTQAYKKEFKICKTIDFLQELRSV